MSHYGEIFEPYEPNKDIMYKAFDSYFNSPVLSKIKDVNGTSMYMTKIVCLLGNEIRYIICFVTQDDLPVGTIEKLSNMRWLSFQTRSLPDTYNIPSHRYQPKRDGPLSVVINRINVTPEASTYKCDSFPIIVTLLHKKNESDYQPTGNVIAALETYSTIITLQ
jgi:hypothetical protein